jgi:hypothetical protein
MELELIDISVCLLLLSNTLYDVAFEDGRNLICQGNFLWEPAICLGYLGRLNISD